MSQSKSLDPAFLLQQHNILEYITDAFFVLDRHWRLTYLNPQAIRLMNRSYAELLEQNIWEVFPEAVNSQFYQEYHRAVREQVTVDFEAFYPPYHTWYAVRAYPIPAGLAVYCRNINQRKQSEIALAETSSIMQSVIEGASDIIFVKDRQGRYVVANPTAANWLETSVAAMLGQDDTTLFPPEIAQYIMQLDQQVIQSGESIVYEEEVPKQGEMRSLLSAKYPWRDVQGNILGVIGISRDISIQKAADKALHQSEEQYRSLFESIDEGFCIVEVLFDVQNHPIDYRFLDINAAFERHTGLVQVKGKTARELLPDLESRWIEIYGKVALTGEPYRFENGSDVMNRWFDVFAFRFGQPEQRQVAIRFKDISERKAAEVERERLLQREQAAREEAELANRIKDEFLAVLSHELRTPLNPILGWTRILQSQKLDEDETTEALNTIARNATLQAQLVDDLLDVSRILRGKLTLDVTTVSLTTTIQAAIATIQLAAKAKQIQIHTQFAPEDYYVSGDAMRLQQVIWNLLSNAVKFTPIGGQVAVKLSQVDHLAQIQVSDTGKGIKPDFLPYLFDHFRQEDGSITRKFGGLGLGLAITRQFVELHGGTVSALSAGENQGATFTIQLPLLKSEVATQPETSLPAVDVTAESPLKGLKILVVDDKPDSLDFIRFLLTQEGATVVTISTAREALQAIAQEPFDILASDIGMPEIDGYELIRQVRALPQGQRILALAITAFAQLEDQHRALQSGFQAYVTKPIDPIQLLATLTQLIRDAGKS